MKPVILLTGTNGQVGRELNRMLPSLGDVTALDRQRLDLSKPEEIRRVIRAVGPTLIVNAAAYTAVDKAESDEAAARAVNAEAPAIMAEEAKKIDASIVHYSTDYVFDGSKTTPYDENDLTNPQNVYGKTKLEGEHAIQQSGVPHLIFRTAWVYATQGHNFLLTILKLATQREEVRIVRDQIGAPTWSAEIALATMRVLTNIYGGEKDRPSVSEVSGIYQMTAAGETSWYEFTKAILEEAAKANVGAPWFKAATNNLPLIVRRVVPITTEEYPTLARRPAHAVLSNARLARTFGVCLPDWRTQVHAVFAGILPNLPQA
jgi:dTDP-4-dehydrorhamnose reductase